MRAPPPPIRVGSTHHPRDRRYPFPTYASVPDLCRFRAVAWSRRARCRPPAHDGLRRNARDPRNTEPDSAPATFCETPNMRRELPDGLVLDDYPARVDVDAVHDFPANESYWAAGRARDVVERLVRGAQRVVGLYDGDRQVGFARAFTDG